MLSSSCTEIDIPAEAGDVASDDGMGGLRHENQGWRLMGTAWTGYGGARAAARQYQMIEGNEKQVCSVG